jgi:hypothetical protein
MVAKQRASAKFLKMPEATKRKSRSPHKVRFETDSENQIFPEVDTGRVELTEEEKKLMWWDGGGRRRAKLHARAYKKELEEDEGLSTSYGAKFHQALDMCLSKTLLQNVPLISNSSARGLEHQIFPELTESRHRAVRMVLMAQKQLPDKVTPDNQAALLSSVSKNLTRTSRRVARLLGIGDARVAAEPL